MYPCPKGHQSGSGDYCDECGAPIGAAEGSSAGSSGSALGGSVGNSLANDPGSNSLAASTHSSTPDADAATGSGERCPDCSTERAGRFCEVCGHDFVLAGYGSGPDRPAPVPASATPPAGAPAAASGAPSPSPNEPAPPDAAPVPDGAAWRLVVTVDPAYYERMHSQADADTEPIALPAYVPERRFTLERQRILIGRRSRSRGIEPDVDLSGPPTDPAVSHAHALLLHQPDGGWTIVDLGSSNGTYINAATDPLAANVPVPLADGDVICVGAWTALTLRRG